LRVDLGIAVDLGGRGKEEGRSFFQSKTEAFMGAVRPDLEGVDWPLEVVDRGGRGGEVEHVVDFTGDMHVVGDVVVDEAELLVTHQVGHILGVACDQVVETGDLCTRIDEPGAEVRPEEPCPTHDDGMFSLEFLEPAERRSAHVEHCFTFQCDFTLHRQQRARVEIRALSWVPLLLNCRYDEQQQAS
jgi:hypothetical protein